MNEPGVEPFNDSFGSSVPPAAPRSLRIEFTGSGSEYFRIWIVNLLLILLTLGLYLPFAKARRLRYFYGNTVVDGQALSFHGDPWRMFRGFLLLVVLAGVYSVAGHVSPVAGLVAFGVLAAIWPALWRSSLRFRIGNTSWRGLRMSFRGSLGGAYLAMLPLYLPAPLLFIPALLLDPKHPPAPEAMVKPFVAYFITVLVAMVALYTLGFALIKRYQHAGYACAGQQTRLEVPLLRFYGLALKGLLVWLGVMFLAGIVFGSVAFVFDLHKVKPEDARSATIATTVMGGAIYLFVLSTLGAWFTARVQNLVWSGTASAELQFVSRLRMRDLAGLTAVNWLLTVLTLGLYRPFAAVSNARLRLEAVSISLDGDIDTWMARDTAIEQDASGDAAGDFFGFDVGL